ncbi:hypothetical protein CDL15_Pgr027392 [Punica granatum]|nr:hypothetical protein CDL15_Pgr027392 [Punica granatum]
MAEMMSLLRCPNRAASSSTPPPAYGSMVDPVLWISPTHMQESDNVTAPVPILQLVPIPPPTRASMVQPINDPLPPLPAPTDVPPPPVAFLMSDPTRYAPLSLSMPVSPPVYTVPSPRIFPASSAFALAHPTEPFIFQTSQPNTSLPYQAPPLLNMLFLEPSMPTHAAPAALPANFPIEAETEQEQRFKKIEEIVKAL